MWVAYSKSIFTHGCCHDWGSFCSQIRSNTSTDTFISTTREGCDGVGLSREQVLEMAVKAAEGGYTGTGRSAVGGKEMFNNHFWAGAECLIGKG